MEKVLQEKMVLLSNKNIDDTKKCIKNIIDTEGNILGDNSSENNKIKNAIENTNKNENNEIESLDLQIYYKNIDNVHLISNISKDFNYIKILVDETNQLLNLINTKIEILKKNHSNILEESKVSDNITLDSFLFQSSILDENLNNRKNIFSRIQNKIYSDYYKLYKNITKFYSLIIKDEPSTNEIENKILNKDYIPYNDLDKHLVYDFDNIIKLNKDILGIINFIIELIKKKTNYIKLKEKNLSIGYDVDFLVNYENYNKLYLINSLNLYTNNININNCLHYKHLLSFYSQLKYFYLLIVKHISFEDENIYSNFYNYHDKIDHGLIDSIINIDNNIIDITSHLYTETMNIAIQTEEEIKNKETMNIAIQTEEEIKNEEIKNEEIKNEEIKNEEIKNESFILKKIIIDYDKKQNIFEKIFFCNIL